MERAVFIKSISEIEYVIHANNKYNRIYFGSEFCERLIPQEQELVNIIDYCRRNAQEFTFVTSYVSDRGLNKLVKLIDKIAELNFKCEIVVNDWGLMNLLLSDKKRYRNFEICLGRLLSKISKSPRVNNIYDYLNEFQKEAVGTVSIQMESTEKFLLNKGISRYEIDNVYQDVFIRGKMNVSLHYPYVFISTTKSCLVGGISEELSLKRGESSCRRECQSYIFDLNHPILKEKIICKGNTYYYENHKFEDKLKYKGIDRIVYHINI